MSDERRKLVGVVVSGTWSFRYLDGSHTAHHKAVGTVFIESTNGETEALAVVRAIYAVAELKMTVTDVEAQWRVA